MRTDRWMRRLRNGLAMAGCAALVCPAAARTEGRDSCVSDSPLGVDGTAALRRAAGTDRALKPADVDAWRRRVWQIWCRQVEAGEPPLPVMAPLDSARTGCWHLPDTLEPHADLLFYWGTKGERPAGGWPLYVYLHGSGPKADEWAAGWSLSRCFDDAPSLYFIPRIPNEAGYYRWWQRAKLFAWERLLRLVMAGGEVDPDRLYLFGISEGGYGSQRLASFYADYWAAAGPMAGGEPLRNAPPENCGEMGFSLLTGELDATFVRNRLTRCAAQAFDSLQRACPGRYVHRVELVPGCGHGIDYTRTTPWLSRHVRRPRPKHFVWEDFALDGCRRTGFHNLRIDERPDTAPDARTRYELDVEGNDIRLTVCRVDYEVMSRDSVWGIELEVAKHFTPIGGGRLTVFLDETLVDLRRPVTLTVNGRRVWRGRVPLRLRHLWGSCLAFGDPRRLFPAAIEVAW